MKLGNPQASIRACEDTPRRLEYSPAGLAVQNIMKTHRLARVSEAVREVASETILFELRDPRVKNVTVTRAEVSGDLQHAKVFVSIMGTPKEQQLCMHGLKHSAGFIQAKLAKRLQTRFTPVVHFVLDQGVKKSIEMTRLINEALGQTAPSIAPADGTAEEDSESSDL
jgi:ribosome-binding factor A